MMLTTVQGIYRDGKIVLLEMPPGIEEAKVMVTFLPLDGPIDLREQGVSEAAAADLRWRLSGIVEDWDNPDMDVYNDLSSF